MTDTFIFDMDGTLIDTEKYYNRCWVQAVRDAGFFITPGQALEFRSLGRPFAPERFRELFGDGFDYHAVREHRKKLMEEMIREEGLALKPGVTALLKELKSHGLRPMIATATDMERTERYLRQLGIYDCFDRIISAVMVKKGKPAPDIYLYACEQAGRKPQECIAIEDSPNGVRSAAAAGCKVVMIPDLTPPSPDIEPLIWKTFDSLERLIPVEALL